MVQSIRHGRFKTAMLLSCATSFAACSLANAGMPENVKNAKSVTFVQTHLVGEPTELQFTSYHRGHAMRMEQSGGLVIIGDFKNKNLVQLNTKDKFAWEQVLNDKVAKEFANPIPFLANLASENIEVVEVEQKNGHTHDVCKVNGKMFMPQPGKTATEVFQVWVDRQTRLPTRIHVEVVTGGRSIVTEFTKFKWNIPLKDELFDTTIPAGYRVAEKD